MTRRRQECREKGPQSLQNHAERHVHGDTIGQNMCRLKCHEAPTFEDVRFFSQIPAASNSSSHHSPRVPPDVKQREKVSIISARMCMQVFRTRQVAPRNPMRKRHCRLPEPSWHTCPGCRCSVQLWINSTTKFYLNRHSLEAL